MFEGKLHAHYRPAELGGFAVEQGEAAAKLTGLSR
jgi:hypothetical protein